MAKIDLHLRNLLCLGWIFGVRALLLEGLRGLLSERDSVLAYTDSPENPLIGPRLSVARRDPLEWENAAASGLPIAPFEGPSPVEALRLV